MRNYDCLRGTPWLKNAYYTNDQSNPIHHPQNWLNPLFKLFQRFLTFEFYLNKLYDVQWKNFEEKNLELRSFDWQIGLILILFRVACPIQHIPIHSTHMNKVCGPNSRWCVQHYPFSHGWYILYRRQMGPHFICEKMVKFIPLFFFNVLFGLKEKKFVAHFTQLLHKDKANMSSQVGIETHFPLHNFSKAAQNLMLLDVSLGMWKSFWERQVVL